MYDVIVAGLGGIGSAVLARCALRGARVLGIERFTRGHELGASAGKTRIIRQAYFENPAYVPLLLSAYEAWADLERRTGTELVRLCGLLMCGRAESEVIAGAGLSARTYDLPADELTAAEIRRRWPALVVRDDEVAIFERAGGAVFPERALRAHLDLAERSGAEMRFETALAAWSSDGEKVTVTLQSGERIEAGALAIALGPWIDRELAALGVPIRVQRNVQLWFEPETRAYDAAAGFPAFLLDREEFPAHLYGFPDFGAGVKAAFHAHGETTHADALRREVDGTEDVEPVAAALAGWMPHAAGRYLAGKACMYSLTPDGDFVVDRHPEHPNVVLLGGFSGHGYKFAAILGEVGADLALRGETAHDIGFLSARRFGAAR